MTHHNRISLGLENYQSNLQLPFTRRSLSFLSKDSVHTLSNAFSVDSLIDTIHRHDINGQYYLRYLLEIRNFKIILVCDDSITMRESGKWSQLRDTLEIMLDLVNQLKIECDVYFTNRLGYRNVHSFNQIKATFNVRPSGSIRRFTDLFDMAINYNRLELIRKKLHVIMLVDGPPTPKLNDRFSTLNGFKHILKHRESIGKVFVTISTCKNDRFLLDMFHKWEKSVKNFAIVNDFDNEQKETMRQRYLYLSFGDYVTTLLIGSTKKICDTSEKICLLS